MGSGVFWQDAWIQASIISIKHLVSEAQGYETIRQLRWSEGVCCPRCESGATIKRGFDGPEQHLQRYEGQREAAHFRPGPAHQRIGHLRPPARVGLRAQDGQPLPRRVRPRRGRRRLPRSPRQHHGGPVVAAAPPPGHFAGQAAALPGLFRVRLQPQKARQAPAFITAGSPAQKDPKAHIEPFFIPAIALSGCY